MDHRDVTRRDFLRGAAALGGAAGAFGAFGGNGPAAAGLPASGRAAAPDDETPAQGRRGRPRIGAVSWCFHSFGAGSSPEEAIDILGELGFEGVDLILLARRDVEGFWTDERIGAIRKRLERNGLEVAQFVIFQPVVEGLTSLEPAVRRENLEWFEKGCAIGKKLGAPVIDIVAPWPRELRGPTGYLPRYYEIEDPDPGETFHIDIAEGFDWDAVWQSWVETVKACLERVKAHGMRFSVEHHTHCLVHDATAFLRLWDAVRDPDLGLNLDTGWTASQREYPPLAIHKAGPRLMNVHARDIDGLMRRFVHVGEGVMDFGAVAEALKAVNYTGFISIEQDKYPGDMRATCKRFVEMMREHLGA